MWGVLHCFGAGIAFAFGVCSGAILCQLANAKGREEFVADLKSDREAIEQRLSKQCENSLRMAVALESLASRNVKGDSR